MKKIFSTALFAALSTLTIQSQNFSSGYSFSTRVCNGGLFVTGSNSYGQLGNGSSLSKSTVPVAVPSLNSNVSAVSGGGSHCLALKNDGTVWAWGWNNFGQLGNGNTTDSNTPIQVSALSNISKICAGSNHNIALTAGGTVYTWGYNGSGQLGNNTTTTSKNPIQVGGLTNVSQVAAGRYHSMALKNDGTLWVWGQNIYGQLGDGTTNQSKVPIQIGLQNVIQIAGGEEHSLALLSDGTVWAWGYNNYGQLGNGSNAMSNVPVQVSGLTSITDISTVLGDHCVALKNDGTVWAWGYNYYGQLGNNSNVNSNVPVQVSGLTGVTNVEAGGNHCLVKKNDGAIWAWGSNVNGELGDGTSVSKKTAVGVGDLCVFTVGISKQNFSDQISVYPNPASDKLSVQLQKEAQVTIYDQSGKQVMKDELSVGSNQLDVHSLREGGYLLRLTSEGQVHNIKLVKVQE